MFCPRIYSYDDQLLAEAVSFVCNSDSDQILPSFFKPTLDHRQKIFEVRITDLKAIVPAFTVL
jgi:hypothetical protein